MKEISWEEFKAKQPSEQVKEINGLLKSNQEMTIKKLSVEVFKLKESTLSKHMNRLGYAVDKATNQYIENRQNKGDDSMMINDNSNQKEEKVIKSNQKNTLRMYADINELLLDSDNQEVVRATVKMTKSSSDKLDEFLKAHKILNKQDVISAAIEMFLKKYN